MRAIFQKSINDYDRRIHVLIVLTRNQHNNNETNNNSVRKKRPITFSSQVQGIAYMSSQYNMNDFLSML